MILTLVIACAQPPVIDAVGPDLAPAIAVDSPEPSRVVGQLGDLFQSPRAVIASDTGDTGAEPLPWFVDADGDGWGAGEPLYEADAPSGTVSQEGDCDDDDARAWPGQELFYITPRADGSWDFDCDEQVELGWAWEGVCDADCRLEAQGWAAVAPPDCGVAAGWLSACSDEVDETCEPISETDRVQPCR